VVLLLPVLIPVAMLLHRKYECVLRRTAEGFVCLSCREVLGVASVRRADDAWVAYMARLRREHPGVLFRLLRLTHAICVHCGQEYTYREKERTFVRTEGVPGGGRGPRPTA
jgi:hypothetical protein